MNASLLAVLNDAERLLVAQTERAELAALDEDAAIDLEARIRRVRNKYVGQYRRAASARVVEHSGRGTARPENKRVWASLVKGKTAVIEEVAEEMDRRDPSRSTTRLALTDGERALQIRVDKTLTVTLILDLMHVLEKLWKAAYVFHAEGSLEADLWVIDRTLRILFGEVGQVVKGVRQATARFATPMVRYRAFSRNSRKPTW